MDPDVNIYKRQMQEEVGEKYYLLKRIAELTEEIEDLREQLAEAKPNTISGKERAW